MIAALHPSSVIGVDVGGTTVKAARVDRADAVEATRIEPTPGAGPDAVIAAIADVVRDLSTEDVTAVGVVVPGVVRDGRVERAVNVALEGVDLRSVLQATLGLPVAVGHDVAAAAQAEAAAAASDNLLYVAIGTGVAAAHVRDGQVDRGAHGQAGEIGHLCVVPDGEPCGCGGRGCVEAYASAASIARRWRAAGRVGDAAAVVDAIDSDAAAAALWREAVDALAVAVAAGICLLDPTAVVIGGGLAQAGERLLDPLRSAVRGRIAWRAVPPLDAGLLGTAAGRLGAARLARCVVASPTRPAKEATA